MPTQDDSAGTTTLLYNSYLVRFWKDALDGPWRASAQSVTTGEIVRFGSPQALFVFLEKEIGKGKKQVPREYIHNES